MAKAKEEPKVEEEEIEAPLIDDEDDEEEEVAVEEPKIPVPVAEDETADAVAESHRSQLRVIRAQLQSQIDAIDEELK